MQEENTLNKLIESIARLTDEIHAMRMELSPALRKSETLQRQQVSEDQLMSSIRKVRDKVAKSA